MPTLSIKDSEVKSGSDGSLKRVEKLQEPATSELMESIQVTNHQPGLCDVRVIPVASVFNGKFKHLIMKMPPVEREAQFLYQTNQGLVIIFKNTERVEFISSLTSFSLVS